MLGKLLAPRVRGVGAPPEDLSDDHSDDFQGNVALSASWSASASDKPLFLAAGRTTRKPSRSVSSCRTRRVIA